MSPFLSNVRNAHSRSAIPSPRGGPELSKQSACRDQSRPEMDSRLAQTKWSRSKTKPRIPELPSHFFNPRPRKKSQSVVGAFEVDRPLRRAMQSLDCDRSFDRRVRVVINQFEIFEFEVADVVDRRIQFHSRQRTILTGQLFARLVEMVVVKVQIAKGVNEIARHKIDNVCHHHRQERIRRDIERHAEKQIAATLVELAA